MRSGLQWDEEYSGTSDVIEMLFGAGMDDRAHYAASKPLQDEPGSTWYYSTGTSMILSRIIADHVGYGDEGTTWAQDNLFGPLGITTVEHDLDASGVMSGGSNINMSARGLRPLRSAQPAWRELGRYADRAQRMGRLRAHAVRRRPGVRRPVVGGRAIRHGRGRSTPTASTASASWSCPTSTWW